MEGRRGHRISIAASAFLLLTALMVLPSRAEDEQPPPFDIRSTSVVYTTPNSAVVEGDKQGAAAPSNATKQRSRSCHLEPDTAPVTTSNIQFYNAHPNEQSFNLYCDGEWMGLVWRPINPRPKSAGASPRQIAEELREEIPMPDVTIRVNPDIGLAGTESWFWIEGYSGDAIARSMNVFGEMVEVEATVSRYEWAFGDGTVLAGSLGRAYPQRSDVRHVYEKSSSAANAYAVTVRFVFSVRYRIDGGPWTDLPGIARPASFFYQVRESQAVIER